MADRLSREEIARLEAKIAAVEKLTTAEMRVAVTRPSWFGIKRKARKLFKQHGLDRTPEENAVLIVVDPKSHELVIYGDNGVSSRAAEAFWDEVRDAMIGVLREGRTADGLSIGVRMVGEELARLFPSNGSRRGAHPDAVIVE
jgi:uncharacterized membrane protein